MKWNGDKRASRAASLIEMVEGPTSESISRARQSWRKARASDMAFDFIALLLSEAPSRDRGWRASRTGHNRAAQVLPSHDVTDRSFEHSTQPPRLQKPPDKFCSRDLPESRPVCGGDLPSS
jgi:hypothetical protein